MSPTALPARNCVYEVKRRNQDMSGNASRGSLRQEQNTNQRRISRQHVAPQEQGQAITIPSTSSDMRIPARQRSGHLRITRKSRCRFVAGLVVAAITSATAQSCVSLADSSQCSAFNTSSISTGNALTGLLCAFHYHRGPRRLKLTYLLVHFFRM